MVYCPTLPPVMLGLTGRAAGSVRLRLRENFLYWILLGVARCRPPAAPFVPDRVRTLVVVSNTALGDTVLATAALRALRHRYAHARLVFVAHPVYAPLIAALGAADAIYRYDGAWRGFLAMVRRLRREHCDLAVILHSNEPQATPLVYLAGARWIFKLPNTSRFRFLLSNREPRLDWSAFRHGIEARLMTAALADAPVEDARLWLAVSDRSAVVDRALGRAGQGAAVVAPASKASGLLIGFQPGASSRSRMWPAEHFVALGRRLLARHPDARIVLTGAATEADYCRAIADQLGTRAHLACGLPIEDLPSLLASLDCVVSGDTGTLHVAVAVGTPVVGLYAVSDPTASGPAQDLTRHEIIYRPCTEAVSTKSEDDRCIARITVADVEAACERVLARSTKRAGRAEQA